MTAADFGNIIEDFEKFLGLRITKVERQMTIVNLEVLKMQELEVTWKNSDLFFLLTTSTLIRFMLLIIFSQRKCYERKRLLVSFKLRL